MSASAPDVVLLLSTFADADTARNVVRTLVGERLVACGNIIPGVESIYTWKGQVEESREVIVFFKTLATRAVEAEARLRALHPYETPEILRLEVDGGLPQYLYWIGESCAPPHVD